jgi:hypothetical protein
MFFFGLDAPKSILETEKTLKTLSLGQIYKKTKKTKKKKKTTGLVFYIKNPGFFQPWPVLLPPAVPAVVAPLEALGPPQAA